MEFIEEIIEIKEDKYLTEDFVKYMINTLNKLNLEEDIVITHYSNDDIYINIKFSKDDENIARGFGYLKNNEIKIENVEIFPDKIDSYKGNNLGKMIICFIIRVLSEYDNNGIVRLYAIDNDKINNMTNQDINEIMENNKNKFKLIRFYEKLGFELDYNKSISGFMIGNINNILNNCNKQLK